MRIPLRPRKWPESLVHRRAYMDPTFAAIAAQYDFMTRVLSFGRDRQWKRKAIGLLRDGGRILDLASGTGDFPLHLRSRGFSAPIIALDRSPEMIALSKKKLERFSQIHMLRGDLSEIPFKDCSFDAVTLGYGLRYVIDIRRLLKEVYRLLRSGGVFVSLDFGIPKSRLYRRLCHGYLLLLGTFWGLALHRKPDTYWHIVESLRAFPGQEAITAWLKETGFTRVELYEQLGGIVALISAARP